jgi:hypothetical protein
MTTDYLASIKKFISGARQYANSNIKTSDGRYAYVTKTGVARMYADETVFNSTAGTNNCPSGFTELQSTWDDLGFPIGSKMAVGEACGREGSFVTASAPKNNFDANFYVSRYNLSGLKTDEDAFNHWNTQGKASGYLPNASILDSMSALGKVGYVDLNTTLHAISNPEFGGDYRQYRQHSNVIGANMTDCTPAEPTVKYGDKVYIGYDDLFGAVHNGFKFGTKKDALFIRPPINSAAVDRTPVKYGDTIVLSSSISNDNTNACGYNGCQAAFVNVQTLKLEFGAGGQTGGTALQLLPKQGGVQVVGDEIKFDDLFGLSAAVTVHSAASLKQGKPLKSGKTVKSTNGQYVLVYQSDGNLAVYATATSAVIWQSNANIPHTPGKVLLGTDGRLVEYDNVGRPNWSAPVAKGAPPYKLSVENNGKLTLLDKNATVLWSTPSDPSSVPSDNEVVWFADVDGNLLKFNAAPNDTVFSFQPLQKAASKICDLANLKQTCNANAECIGFVQSPDNNTWQIIDKASQFTIAPTSQNFYLKKLTVPPVDGCVSSPPKYIEPQFYMAYGVGDAYSAESCKKTSVDPLLQQQSAVLEQNQEKMNQLPQKKSDLTGLNAQISKNDKITAAKTREYKKVLQRQEGFGTMDQQKIDAEIVQNQNKIKAMFWTASAFILLLSVAFIKSKQ